MAIDLGAQKKELLVKSNSSKSKTLVPGTTNVTITGMVCKLNNYRDQDGFDIEIQVVGPDLGEGFVGFFKDKEDPSLGRFNGAVGTVRLNQYTYTTKTYPAKNDRPEQIVTRDQSIIADLNKLANVVGKFDELFEGEVENIPALIAKAARVFNGCTFKATIGGKEWLKDGFIKYNLFIVKPEKGFYGFEAVKAEISKIQPFIPSKHIQKAAVAASDDILGTMDALQEIESFDPVESEFDM